MAKQHYPSAEGLQVVAGPGTEVVNDDFPEAIPCQQYKIYPLKGYTNYNYEKKSPIALTEDTFLDSKNDFPGQVVEWDQNDGETRGISVPGLLWGPRGRLYIVLGTIFVVGIALGAAIAAVLGLKHKGGISSTQYVISSEDMSYAKLIFPVQHFHQIFPDNTNAFCSSNIGCDYQGTNEYFYIVTYNA